VVGKIIEVHVELHEANDSLGAAMVFRKDGHTSLTFLNFTTKFITSHNTTF